MLGESPVHRNYLTFYSVINKKLRSFAQRKIIRLFRPLVNIDNELAEISKKPKSLSFEVVNICNANCIFCGYRYLKRPKAMLAAELFKKVIDEFDAFGGGGIGFTPPVGDPLIDQNFIEKIKYARSKQNISRIGFFSNGILINDVGARAIITSGVNEITISVPGFDAETYLRIYRVNKWDYVYEGLLNLLKENESYNNKVDICIALRSDVPFDKLLKTPVYNELKKFCFRLEYNICYDNWGGLIKQSDLIGKMRLRKIPRKIEPCFHLYAGPIILSNGDLTLCGCRDLNGDSELVIGNIKNRPIIDLWLDPRVKKIREGFYRLKYPIPCQDCSFYSDLSFIRRANIKISNKQ